MGILFLLKSLWESKKGQSWSLQSLLVLFGALIALGFLVYFLWGNIERMDLASGALEEGMGKIGSRG